MGVGSLSICAVDEFKDRYKGILLLLLHTVNATILGVGLIIYVGVAGAPRNSIIYASNAPVDVGARRALSNGWVKREADMTT
jgi:hypothetical protein